jgi:hypothetical protein
MSDSGILQATVSLEENGIHQKLDLQTPSFYAPQAAQVSFGGQWGAKFADFLLKQGEEEWGDLTAAVGPEAGPEIKLLQTRLSEQRDTLNESADDAETVRRITEEVRFIRQDIARIGKKYKKPLLQRRLGKMTAVFNRIARGQAEKAENARLDNLSAKVQKIIDDGDAVAFDDADLLLGEMRELFFSVAWRDPEYAYTWYKRLAGEPYLFPDADAFKAMVAEGEALSPRSDAKELKALVERMLGARIALGANDAAGELATIVKA